MYKLKTKSAAKKRMKKTGTGKVLFIASGKRHNLSKKTQKTKRVARQNCVMAKCDVKRVVRHSYIV